MEKVEMWKCRHCGKVFSKSSVCMYHEATCKKSLFTFSCSDCGNAIKGKRITGFGSWEEVVGCKKGHKPSNKQFVECVDKEINYV